MNIKSVTFRCSALKPADRPQEFFPHVAVAGRSNVGKSSLLNWLFRQNLAKVAKTPGKTRMLNFFLVNRSFYVVDLPGYGYAKVRGQLREQWGRELGHYLATEDRLAGVLSLVDVRRGLTDLDLELQAVLAESGRAMVVVLTKADKLGRGRGTATQREVQRHLGLATPPLMVSVRTGDGRGALLDEIEELVSCWKQRHRGDGDDHGTQEEDNS